MKNRLVGIAILRSITNTPNLYQFSQFANGILLVVKKNLGSYKKKCAKVSTTHHHLFQHIRKLMVIYWSLFENTYFY